MIEIIYTAGHEKNYMEGYDNAKKQGRPFLKLGKCDLEGEPYGGGSVWQTEQEVRAYLKAQNLVTMAPFGLIASWEDDTEQLPGEPFRRLLRDAVIVPLDQLKNKV
jgi:hypothetical protein